MENTPGRKSCDLFFPGDFRKFPKCRLSGTRSAPQIERGKKRKRSVNTGEKGDLPSVPLEVEKKKKPNPKEEADNSTLFYGILAIGTFIGVLFLNR